MPPNIDDVPDTTRAHPVGLIHGAKRDKDWVLNEMAGNHWFRMGRR